VDQPRDSNEQLVRRHRLGEIVITAHKQAGDAIVRLGPGSRDEEDRKRVAELIFQLFANLVAADSGQADVEDGQSQRFGRRAVECCFPRQHGACHIARTLENLYHRCALIGRVVDNQNRVAWSWLPLQTAPPLGTAFLSHGSLSRK